MAKIKLGSIIADIRGKLGGHVYSKNRGGAYVRTKVTPVNRQTSAQSAVRSMFGSISSRWSTLSEAQRQSFRNKVSQFASTDIFGDIRNPSGKTLFQKLSQNLALVGVKPITECPDAIALPQINGISVEHDISVPGYMLATDGDTTGSNILVFATAPLSQGTKFVKNKLRLITKISGADDATANLKDAYDNKFGTLSQTDNVYFAIKTVNASGQASPLFITKMLPA